MAYCRGGTAILESLLPDKPARRRQRDNLGSKLDLGTDRAFRSLLANGSQKQSSWRESTAYPGSRSHCDSPMRHKGASDTLPGRIAASRAWELTSPHPAVWLLVKGA